MYAIKSPETKKRYPDRFKAFLDFIQNPGTNIEQRLVNFYNPAKQNLPWLEFSYDLFHISKRMSFKRGDICINHFKLLYTIKFFLEYE